MILWIIILLFFSPTVRSSDSFNGSDLSLSEQDDSITKSNSSQNSTLLVRINRATKSNKNKTSSREFPNFLGSNLFDGDRKKCFSLEDVNLLAARREFERAMIPKSSLPLILNDKSVTLIMRYFSHGHLFIRRMDDSTASRILRKAFFDTFGGFLHHYLVPVVKMSYYVGNVQLRTVRKVLDYYQKCRFFLNTNGNGWRSPYRYSLNDVKDLSYSSIATEEYIYPIADTDSNTDEDYCKDLNIMMKKDTDIIDENMLVSLPRIDLEDKDGYLGNIWLPYRRKTTYSLKSRSAAFLIVKFYKKVSLCYEHKHISSNIFDIKFKEWIKENLLGHLFDEQFYPSFGGLLSLYNHLSDKPDKITYLDDDNDDYDDTAVVAARSIKQKRKCSSFIELEHKLKSDCDKDWLPMVHLDYDEENKKQSKSKSKSKYSKLQDDIMKWFEKDMKHTKNNKWWMRTKNIMKYVILTLLVLLALCALCKLISLGAPIICGVQGPITIDCFGIIWFILCESLKKSYKSLCTLFYKCFHKDEKNKTQRARMPSHRRPVAGSTTFDSTSKSLSETIFDRIKFGKKPGSSKRTSRTEISLGREAEKTLLTTKPISIESFLSASKKSSVKSKKISKKKKKSSQTESTRTPRGRLKSSLKKSPAQESVWLTTSATENRGGDMDRTPKWYKFKRSGKSSTKSVPLGNNVDKPFSPSSKSSFKKSSLKVVSSVSVRGGDDKHMETAELRSIERRKWSPLKRRNKSSSPEKEKQSIKSTSFHLNVEQYASKSKQQISIPPSRTSLASAEFFEDVSSKKSKSPRRKNKPKLYKLNKSRKSISPTDKRSTISKISDKQQQTESECAKSTGQQESILLPSLKMDTDKISETPKKNTKWFKRRSKSSSPEKDAEKNKAEDVVMPRTYIQIYDENSAITEAQTQTEIKKTPSQTEGIAMAEQKNQFLSHSIKYVEMYSSKTRPSAADPTKIAPQIAYHENIDERPSTSNKRWSPFRRSKSSSPEKDAEKNETEDVVMPRTYIKIYDENSAITEAQTQTEIKKTPSQTEGIAMAEQKNQLLSHSIKYVEMYSSKTRSSAADPTKIAPQIASHENIDERPSTSKKRARWSPFRRSEKSPSPEKLKTEAKPKIKMQKSPSQASIKSTSSGEEIFDKKSTMTTDKSGLKCFKFKRSSKSVSPERGAMGKYSVEAKAVAVHISKESPYVVIDAILDKVIDNNEKLLEKNRKLSSTKISTKSTSPDRKSKISLKTAEKNISTSPTQSYGDLDENPSKGNKKEKIRTGRDPRISGGEEEKADILSDSSNSKESWRTFYDF